MRILLAICDLPHDPTNGAARSMRTIAEMMAARGHNVHAVAPAATERPCDIDALLAPFKPRPFATSAPAKSPAHYEFTHRGIEYMLLNVGESDTADWRTAQHEAGFSELFDSELRRLQPELVLCFGGYPSDAARYDRAQRAGAKLVFGLRNFGYGSSPGLFARFDGVFTGSQFLTDWYAKRNIKSTPLPLPIQAEDVVAEQAEPKYFTAINPTPDKGLRILETVFGWLEQNRPEIPRMVVTDSPAQLSKEAFWHTEIMPWTPDPKEIYQRTKVLLVPSVWEEPAGRVIAEALLNGIPPIITDRGGMVETANYGAIVLPLNPSYGPRSIVGMDVARPWIDAIVAMHDDVEAYNYAREMACLAGQLYHPDKLATVYEDYLQGILAGQPAEELSRC